MTSTPELLADLRSKGIKLGISGGNLSVSAPKGVMTSELKRLLSENKAELLDLLVSVDIDSSSEFLPITKQPRDRPLPLSFAQQRLWFLDQMDPGLTVYNVPLGYRIHGNLNTDALQKAINTIVARHEVLRTRFIVNNGQAVQDVVNLLPSNVTIDDLSGYSNREQLLTEALEKLSYHIFQLDSGPLFFANLFKLSDNEHYLFINVHHAIFDGSSISISVKELLELYAAQVESRPAKLPPLDIQYQDYSVWQYSQMENEAIKKQLDFWRQCFDPLPEPMELPTDRRRPEVQSYAGALYSIDIEATLVDSLTSLARQQGVSLFMLLLSAVNILCYKYARATDQTIGTPIANRPLAELQNLIGYFANTLVLRTQFTSSTTVRELIILNKDICLNAYANQDVPFENIVEEVHPRRDASRTPLFQLLLAYQDANDQALVAPGIELSPQSPSAAGARTDITIDIINTNGKLRVNWEYATALFDHFSIEQMSHHFKRVLVQLENALDKPIGKLELLNSDEKNNLLAFNPPATEYNRDKFLVHCVADKAEQQPAVMAVISGDRSYTYGELNNRANQLAHYLIAHGVRHGDLVGICIHRSVDLLVAVLGILKTGAAYVPLDPDYPIERLRYMVDTAKVTILLTEDSLYDFTASFECQRVSVDGDWQAISTESDSNPTINLVASDLAYVIFTSGSTGKPKGVQVPHGAVMNFLHSMAKRPGLQSSDRLLAVTTLSFDIAVLELYLPLVVGATTVIASREASADGRALVELMQRHDINIMQATPSTWRLLLGCQWQGNEKFKVLCGGEAFPRDLAESLLEKVGEVWNMYGPTETTVWSTCWRVTNTNQNLPIGSPIDNTQCYVLDEQRQLVPIGVPGELYIGGDGVTKGYFAQADLTNERFIDDPFNTTSNSKMYRTGDLVRWRPNGDIEYLQRVDFQVKVRGFRIELGEIEAVLSSHQDIKQAVVVVREDRPGDQRLAAYIVLEAAKQMTVTEMRRFVKQHLPDYMVPHLLMILPSLPLTPNGKVDRNGLPKPFSTLGEQVPQPPVTDTQRQLAKIWQDILGVDQVGLYDNFFDLGGHSLLSLQVIRRIHETWFINLNPRYLLLENLEQVAAKVTDLTGNKQVSEAKHTKSSAKVGIMKRLFG